MRQLVGLIVVAGVAALASPGMAGAQSFNCNYAKAPDEVMICNSPSLSKLDEQMSVMYFQTRNSLAGAPRARLEGDQVAWLRGRQACGGDPDCLADAYRERIHQLSNY